MSFSPPDYLRHILDETAFLIQASKRLNLEAFRNDPMAVRAFVRSLEVIGEATKQLPAEFRNAHPDIDWRRMAGMRDRLIHGYFAVSEAIVWDIVTEKVPVLDRQIRTLLPKD